METNEFEDRIKQIKNKLLNLERVGIDTQEYRNRLNNIEVGNNANASSFQVEFKANENLFCLESELSKYDLIISLYNYCKSIDLDVLKIYKKAIISKDGLNINEIQDYITKIEDYLINLYNDKNNKTSDKLLSGIYEIVYYLIKIEIILTNRSTLYDFIKNKNIDTRYINALIFNDINESNKIKDENLKKTLIKKRLDTLIPKVNKDSLNYNYFNIEIIKLLLMLESNYDAYKELEQEFDSKFEVSRNLRKSSESLDYKIVKASNKLESIKDDLRKTKKYDLKMKIMSFIVTLTMTFTGLFVIGKVNKKNTTFNSYTKTTEYYSSLTDDTINNEEECINPDPEECFNIQHLKSFGLWQDNHDGTFSRIVRVYDLSSYELYDSVDKIDLEQMDVIPVEYIETITKEEMQEEPVYDETITELYSEQYNYNGVYFDKAAYTHNIFICYSLYIIMMMIMCKTLDLKSLKSIINNINDINDDIKNSTIELEKYINQFLKYINSNNELLEEFNKLYQENIDLLDDEEELMEKLTYVFDRVNYFNTEYEFVLRRAKGSINYLE